MGTLMSDPTNLPTLTRDVPDAVLTEIGRAVVEWSFLEEIVNLGIAGMLKMDPKFSRRITGPIRNFRQRQQILRNLCEVSLKDKKDRERFKETFKAIDDAYTERNQLAHAVWWGLEDANGPVLQFVKPGTPFQDKHPHQIHHAALKIRSAADALTDFLVGPGKFSWPNSLRTKL